MRVSTTLTALAVLIALAGCARPPDAQADALETVQEEVGGAGPDLDPLNLPPTTLLQATPTSGRAPLAVVFSLSARDVEGDKMSWTLDPGDGSALKGGGTLPVAVEHTYPAGRFQVTFLVTDGKETATARMTIQVAAPTSQAPVGGGGGAGNVGGGGGGGGGAGAGPSDGGTTTSTSTSSSAQPTSSSTTTSRDRGRDRTSSSTMTTSQAQTSTSETTTSTSETTTSTSETTTSTGETTTSTSQTSTTSETTTSTSASSTTTQPSSNSPPSAGLTAAQDSPTAPSNVTYTVAASDPDGDVVAWTLDLQGDGTVDADGSGADGAWTVVSTFDQPGSYTAVLTVTDGQETASDSVTVTVS